MSRYSLSLASLLLLVGCPEPTPHLAEDPPKPTPCVSACANLKKLRCPEAETPADGARCEDVCERTIRFNLTDPACVSAASTREKVRLCNIDCE